MHTKKLRLFEAEILNVDYTYAVLIVKNRRFTQLQPLVVKLKSLIGSEQPSFLIIFNHNEVSKEPLVVKYYL